MPASGNNDLGEITRLLNQLSNDRSSDHSLVLEQLMPLVYNELKALARSNRYRWRGDLAPGTTSLVHEAYAKLAARPGAGYENRGQFFCVASKAMRSILIDNARWHSRQKRGEGIRPLPLREEILVSADRCDELIALDDALTTLEDREPGLARIVECRCFGGLTVEETSEALGVSPSTVKRRWSLARAWLYRELQPSPA